MLDLRVVAGRLTRDPDIKDLSDDLKVANFSIAVDSDYKDKETNEKTTEFVDCVAWRGTASFIENYIPKGRMVVIVGRMKTDQYEDSKWHNDEGDSLTRRKQVLVVDSIYPMDSKKSSEQEEEPKDPPKSGRQPSKTSGKKSGSKLPDW